MPEIEQRDRWELDKWGKFSASEVWKLLVPGPVIDKITGEKAMFGDTALTYIERVARETYTLYNKEENPISYAMKMGIEREAGSAGFYQRTLGLDKFVYYGVGNSRFFPWGLHAGVSPDLVLWLDEPNQIASLIAEMKNPSPKVHEWNLDNIVTAKDLEKAYSDYYTQCQSLMLALNCDLAHWCSHNEYFTGNERLLIIEVPADKNFQNSLSLRLKAAIRIKKERIKNREERLKRLI